MSAKLDEVPVYVHLPHPESGEHTLCGKYNTRLTPISTNGVTDCISCIMLNEEENMAHID